MYTPFEVVVSCFAGGLMCICDNGKNFFLKHISPGKDQKDVTHQLFLV